MNLQRENILPSERTQAYKMKMKAIKRQGVRTDSTSPQLAAKFRSDDEIAKADNVSGDTVRRYIRLTELEPELRQMVDEKKSDLDKLVLPTDTIRKYFPRSYTPQRMQDTIINLLEQWQKKRQQQH